MKVALITKLGKEPLIWFALVAAVLFLAEHFYEDSAPIPIVVNEQVIARISQLWESQMRKAPSADELESLVENWIAEETFYREAMRIGLGDTDTIVRRRLVQKYQFLIKDADESDIDEAEIKSFYRANLQRYHLPQRLTFTQVLLKDAQSAQAVLSQLKAGENWQTLGKADSLLPKRYEAKSAEAISYEFGMDFYEQLEAVNLEQDLEQDLWQGPISSRYGLHLVRIEAILPAGPVPLASIRSKVRYDAAAARGERNKEKAAAKLRRRYPVVYETP